MPREKTLNKEEIQSVLSKLDEAYPDAGCELDYDSKYHLLLAVVLSAQTTDVSVNKVTPALFNKYPMPEDLALADQEEVEEYIKKIGLYKNKAKNIIALSKVLVDSYNSEVPGSFDELVKLPGVGRKTANVVLSEVFGEQRIAVDTHVYRVSNKIGIAKGKDVLETERCLMKNLPYELWTHAHHLLIFHGRRCCIARKPKCDECPIADLCLDKQSNN